MELLSGATGGPGLVSMHLSGWSFIMKVLMKVLCFESRPDPANICTSLHRHRRFHRWVPHLFIDFASLTFDIHLLLYEVDRGNTFPCPFNPLD